MRKDYLNYLEETIFIEELAHQEFGIVKHAGVLDILGGVADSIKNTISSQIRGDSAGEIGKGLIRLVTPGILFRLHPLVGILYAIGNAIGFDIVDFFEKIWNYLKPHVEQGATLTSEMVNSAGKSLLASEAGPLEAEASQKSWIELIKEAQIFDYTKEMAGLGGGRTKVPHIPWLFSKSESPVQRIFGNLLQSGKTGRAKWLLGGFIIWIIKTVLAGAGLLAGAGAIKSLISPQVSKLTAPEEKPSLPSQPKQIDEYLPEEEKDTSMEVKYEAQKPSNVLQASGRGEQYFENDAETSWIVPLINSSVEDTLLAWIIDIYPNTFAYKNLIQQSNSFQNMVSQLERNWKSASPTKLMMPKNFHSRKQVVDSFISSSLKST